MSQLPLVSIIMTTYNRDYILTKAIDSVLAQTYKNIEIIIVDDGSTDNTKFVLLNKYGPRVKYVYKENGGQASGLNFGLKIATGNIVGFIDSDDKYKPNHVATLTSPIINEGYDFTMGTFELIHEGPIPEVMDYFDNSKTIPITQCEASTGVLMGKKDVILKLGAFQGLLVDIDLLQRIKKHKYTLKKIDTKTYEYYYGLCSNSILLNMAEEYKYKQICEIN